MVTKYLFLILIKGFNHYFFKQKHLYASYTINTIMKKKPIIQRVWINKSSGQKHITIPKESGIKEGDFVRVEKVKIK